MDKLVSVKDFLEAPVDYKTNFTRKFEELNDEYWDTLEKHNRKLEDENDHLKIMTTGIDKRMVEETVDRLNELRPESRKALFIGRTIYNNPYYVIIVGPVSRREYFWCMNDLEL